MDPMLVQSVSTETAMMWGVISMMPLVLTIFTHLFIFRKMAYFKERKGLKWLATIGLFILLSVIKPFVAQAMLSGQM